MCVGKRMTLTTLINTRKRARLTAKKKTQHPSLQNRIKKTKTEGRRGRKRGSARAEEETSAALLSGARKGTEVLD